MSGVGELLRGRLAPPRPDPPLPSGTPAGVLVPILERAGTPPALLFTVRSDQVRDHKGEISFPGGVRHEEDPDLLATAVRETEEELGIRADRLEILGALPPVHTVVTGYVILPFVALLREGVDLDPSPVEIAEVLELEIGELVRVEEEVTLEARQAWFAYTLDGHTVWGATGRIVHAFLEALWRSGWRGRTGG
ncbi:MAG: NUDIX hydrolase [Actinomycetota bacterium]